MTMHAVQCGVLQDVCSSAMVDSVEISQRRFVVAYFVFPSRGIEAKLQRKLYRLHLAASAAILNLRLKEGLCWDWDR